MTSGLVIFGLAAGQSSFVSANSFPKDFKCFAGDDVLFTSGYDRRGRGDLRFSATAAALSITIRLKTICFSGRNLERARNVFCKCHPASAAD